MDKHRILIVVIALLVLLNVILMGRIAFFPDQHKFPPSSGERKNPELILKEKLQLSTDQFDQFIVLKNAHHSRQLSLDQMLRDMQTQYLTNSVLLPEYRNDSLLNNISALFVQLQENTSLHLKEIYTLCEAEQKDRFTKFLDEMLLHMQRGPEKLNPDNTRHPN